MGNSGYVYLLRSVRNTWVRKHRPGEWMDLLMLAACSDRTIMFSGHPVNVRRGQYATTYRKLGDRLGISSLSSVKLFLDRAEEDGLITREPIYLPGRKRTLRRTPDGTLITIVNYDPNQHLRDSENRKRNVDTNAEQHIEEVSEVSDKKQAAAAVQCVCESPAENDTAASGNSGASEVPPELGGIFDLLRGITQVDVDWPVDQASRMVELAEEVGWPVVREHVGRIATREVKKGNKPKSLRYYIRAIREDVSRGLNTPGESTTAVSAVTAARWVPYSTGGRPQAYEPYRACAEAEPEPGVNRQNFFRELFGDGVKE